MKYLVWCSFLVLTFTRCFGQGISSDGRDYYVGIVSPVLNTQPLLSNIYARSYFQGSILISAIAKTEVRVSWFTALGQESEPAVYHVAAFNSKQIDIRDILFQSADNIPAIDEHVVLHVVSTTPITLTALTGGICSGGSYLCLPRQCLGKHYVAISYHDNPSGIGGVFNYEPSAGFCMVIATEDETHVAITPSVTTAEGLQGVRCGDGADGQEHPVDILLNRGQSYFIKSNGTDGSCDLTGTVISANKYVAVLGGHENAYIDNSDIGDYVLEERDFMIEQMMPVECWDYEGYYTIPFFRQTGKADNTPDEVHFINDGSSNNSINIQTGYEQSSSVMTSPFQQPVTSVTEYVPLSLSSNEKKLFAVMQYASRSQDDNHVSPAPSMMSIIPRSCWKNSYRLSVPQPPQGIYSVSYVTFIIDAGAADDEIIVSHNGGQPIPLSESGLLPKQRINIPFGYIPSIVTCELPPGEYYFSDNRYDYTRKSPALFMAYSYSYKAVNTVPGNPLLSPTDAFYSTANPAGMAYVDRHSPYVPREYLSDYYHFGSYNIVDRCDYWDIEVSSPSGENIRYIELSAGSVTLYQDRYRVVTTKNVELYDEKGIKLNNELICDGSQSTVKLKIKKLSSGDSNSAVIAIYDIYGNGGLLPIFGKATINTSSFKGLIKQDSTHFTILPTGVHQSHSGTLSFSFEGGYRLKGNIRRAYIKGDTSVIHVIQDSSILPVNDSDQSNASITLHFTPVGTLTYIDTLVLISDCPEPTYYYIQGKGEWPRQSLTDCSFGSATVKSTIESECSIKNTGNIPFKIEQVTLSDEANFKIDPHYNTQLPITLEPGEESVIRVKFTPVTAGFTSALILWQTDIPTDDPFISRSFSILTGEGTAIENRVSKPILSDPTVECINNRLIVTSANESIQEVSLYDIAGREVLSSVGGADRMQLSLEGLSHGIYTAKIITISGNYTKVINY